MVDAAGGGPGLEQQALMACAQLTGWHDSQNQGKLFHMGLKAPPARSCQSACLLGNYFHTVHTMTAKQRFRNRYRLEVRERDHLPPHVHLVGAR